MALAVEDEMSLDEAVAVSVYADTLVVADGDAVDEAELVRVGDAVEEGEGGADPVPLPVAEAELVRVGDAVKEGEKVDEPVLLPVGVGVCWEVRVAVDAAEAEAAVGVEVPDPLLVGTPVPVGVFVPLLLPTLEAVDAPERVPVADTVAVAVGVAPGVVVATVDAVAVLVPLPVDVSVLRLLREEEAVGVDVSVLPLLGLLVPLPVDVSVLRLLGEEEAVGVEDWVPFDVDVVVEVPERADDAVVVVVEVREEKDVAVDDAVLVACKRRAPMREVSTGSKNIPENRRAEERSRITWA